MLGFPRGHDFIDYLLHISRKRNFSLVLPILYQSQLHACSTSIVTNSSPRNYNEEAASCITLTSVDTGNVTARNDAE